MDGVIILQTIEKCSWTWGWSWWGFILVLVAIGGLFVAIVFMSDGGGGAFAPIALCIVSIIGAFIMFSTSKEDKVWNQYQVLVDENVSMTEFLENYEIIKTEGITLWVEDKQNEE
jgi:hypothetical protein